MRRFHFRIASNAADYLRSSLRTDTGELLVLTIVPTSQPTRLSLDGGKAEIPSRELQALANDYMKSLSSPVPLRWTVGGTRRSRLKGEELLLISGIECFFPPEVRSAIDSRTLRLKDGELVFDPQLEPPAASLSLRPARKSGKVVAKLIRDGKGRSRSAQRRRAQSGAERVGSRKRPRKKGRR
jgi:hypothetical protein